MTQAHLSTERLQALHDGEPGNSLELEHLASCSACQEAFDDTRWTMLLMSLRSRTDSEDAHPGKDELLAYQIGALGTGREGSIRKHLANCRRCVNEYGRIRVGRQRMRYSSPTPELLQATMTQFRQRTLRRLGRLLIERAGEGLALSFLPWPRSGRRARQAGLAANVEQLSVAAETVRHPASATRRALRLRKEVDEIAAFGVESPARTASIDGSPWSLCVGSAAGAPKESLQIRLASSDESLSAAKIMIRISSEDGNDFSAVTDAQGVVVLPCPSEDSRLIVEVDPPLSIEIVFDD